MIKALILAGGYGSRLGELTKDKPKPTIEVGGKSVIQRIIDSLHSHGILQIIVNVHYLPIIITEKINGNALYFFEEVLLGHEGTISALKNWLSDDNFLVINGDTISTVDYSEMIRVHKKGTITVLYDNWRAAGTWIYDREYFNNPDLPVIPYRPLGLRWFDIGLPERLEEAKEFFK
jgi:NDP-sugar pyrophosphorylase family protein